VNIILIINKSKEIRNEKKTDRKIEMFLFGRSKSPQELVKALRELFLQLERGEKKYEKIAEDVTKCIGGIKNILYGTNDQEPQTEVIAQLAQEIYNANLIKIMIDNIYRVDFEGKKDIASIFNNLLRRQIGNRSPTVDHIASKPEILFRLINGYVEQIIIKKKQTYLYYVYYF
jgi:calcium binding protein 39